jgi:hypothetical protein
MMPADPEHKSNAHEQWREALAILLQGQYGSAKTWLTVSEQARDGWRSDAAEIMESLPDDFGCGHHSWAGLMALLDEHWPEDIFPTRYPDDIKRGAGARIVSLLRWIDRLRGDAR